MSDTTTIRVSRDLFNTVKTMAQQQNENMQDVIEKAVVDYKKKKFFDSLNEAYSKLKADPTAWKEEEEERKEWDTLLKDGAEEDDESK